MIATRLRRIIPAVVLALAYSIPGPAAAQDSSVSGRFHVVWEDPQSPDDPARMRFFLADEESRWTELRIPAHVRQRIGDPMALAGRYVRVNGRRLPATTPALASSATEVEDVELTAAPAGMPSLDFAAGAVSGTQSWVTVLCRFDRSTSTPHSRSWYEQLMGSNYPGLDDYWREVSFNAVDMAGSVAIGWYDLPSRRSAYINKDGSPNLEKLKDDCSAAADADVFFPSFSGIHFQFNETIGCCSWGGTASLNRDGENKVYAMTWLAPWAGQQIYAHEMGHGLGLGHSSGPYGQVYDSDWDVMSGGRTHLDGTFGYIAPHTIAYHKDELGWIDPARRYVAPRGSSATITLHRLGEPASAGVYHMAKIPLAGDAFYTVEARRFYGYDEGLPGDAVVLHHVDPTRAEAAHVVDPDNNGDPNDDGAMWLPGETFTDAAAGVTVRVEAQTSTGFDVTISVDGDGTATPLIAVSPGSLTYETPEGQSPSDQSFTVQNSGSGTLEWSASANQGWLALDRTSGNLSGGASGSVSLRVDASGLAAGTHTGTILVSGNADNSPQTVAVQVTVTPVDPPPLIAVNPTSLAYTATEGMSPTDQSFTVQNSGGGTLDWSASADRSWIGLSLSSGSLSGGASRSVSVSVDASSLAAGTHTGTISVTGNTDNTPQDVAIEVTIAAAEVPLIAVSPASLTFAANVGDSPTPQDFSVQNSGQGALDWTAATDRSWLSASPTGGSLSAGATAGVTVTVDASSLSAGIYSGTVTVSGNADNSPQILAIELQVVEGNDPLIAVSPSSMVVQTKGGGKKIPTPKLGIGNAGGETLSWSANTDQGWFKLAAGTGSLESGASDSVAILLALEGLEPGTYQGTITVSGNASNSPHTIPVELKLTKGAVVKIRRGKLTYAGFEEEQPLAKSFTMENEGDETSYWSASTDQEWILLAAESGTLTVGDTQRVGVSVDLTGLDPGNHSGTITVVGDEDLYPVTLDVSLTVSNGPGVKHSVDVVAAELLDSTNQLGPSEINYLDHVGNGNGQFDVGDLRAWLMQRGDLSGAPPLSVIGSGSSAGEEAGQTQAESETRVTASSIQGRAQ